MHLRSAVHWPWLDIVLPRSTIVLQRLKNFSRFATSFLLLLSACFMEWLLFADLLLISGIFVCSCDQGTVVIALSPNFSCLNIAGKSFLLVWAKNLHCGKKANLKLWAPTFSLVRNLHLSVWKFCAALFNPCWWKRTYFGCVSPSLLWFCGLGDRMGIASVKTPSPAILRSFIMASGLCRNGVESLYF